MKTDICFLDKRIKINDVFSNMNEIFHYSISPLNFLNYIFINKLKREDFITYSNEGF